MYEYHSITASLYVVFDINFSSHFKDTLQQVPIHPGENDLHSSARWDSTDSIGTIHHGPDRGYGEICRRDLGAHA
jgi:hypothetical protein